MKLKLIFFCFLIFTELAFAQKYEDLRSLQWEFKDQNNDQWYPVYHFDVHQDLFANNLIPYPYLEDNELELTWIENRNWEYKTQIKFSQTELNSTSLSLIFEGLDTYAEVFINDSLVLSANNMFRKWKVELKPLLKEGLNDIRILFTSPILKNKKRVLDAPYELPSGNESAAIKVSAYTRKAAYQFGWDWGPRFVTMGIWKPVYFKRANVIELENIYVSTVEINEFSANMKLEIEVDILDSGGIFNFQFMNLSKEVELDAGQNFLSFEFDIKNPKLWNPRGYGDQHLYYEDLFVFRDDERVLKERVRFGIREIKLINEADEIGTSFYFKVNGNDFFAKGANYIPQDLFLNRVEKEDYDRLIQQVLDANFNFIRVWGGGVYEQEYFYNLCDENGILIWQDFMFANSMYPNDQEFKANVEQEIIDNVKALRNHPCIGLWCGNNEIEVAWNNWGWQKQFNYSKTDSTEIWENYQSIFHDMIPSIINEFDPSRPYVPTSPLSNWGNPENFNHSSMHYWGVWHGGEPIENFEKNIGRFMAEYGYQSFPSIETLAKVINPKNLHLNSEAMKHRQKSYIGNDDIINNIGKYTYSDTVFKNWVELSQLVQAHAMSLAIRAHRSKTPHCMGTVFWQLNDCWPGPSWSVIDYFGNPKQAYYEVQNLYKPVIGTIQQTKDDIEVILVSDVLELEDLEVEIALVNPYGKTIRSSKFKTTLDHLKPAIYPLKLSKRLLKKWVKKKYDWKIRIYLSKKGETIFKGTFHNNFNTTVLFP